MSKGKAFFITVICIMVLFLLCGLLLLFGKLSDIPISAFLAAIVSLSAGYMGIQVANNGVRGKWYQSEIPENDRKGKEK